MPDRDHNGRDDRDDLRDIAARAMVARGFLSEQPAAARAAADALQPPPIDALRRAARDMTSEPWSSIDNDDSRDLDQIEFARREGHGTRLWVGIAEVDAYCPRGSALDAPAAQNATSVYTAAAVFPMLHRKLSEGLTSLLPEQDRLAMVTEMLVADDGRVLEHQHYPAVVRNHAQLAYDAVSAWLDGHGPPPRALAARPDLEAQVRLQDAAASALRAARVAHGALGLDTSEPRAVRDAGGQLVDIVSRAQTRAGALVEDLMIATNGCVARFLEDRRFPSLRRVVRTPERWDRIVALANEWEFRLPTVPAPKALADFLAFIRASHAEHAEEISLAVIKLIGRGEYVAKAPGEAPLGHFGLAADDYAHSTAPNRRYPDVVTQRLMKAACAGAESPYAFAELSAIGAHCSDRQREAKKIERQVAKSAAAYLLVDRVGQTFPAVVTGASPKGVFVRIARPAVEGRVVQGDRGLDVGARLQVRLLGCNLEKGFIDFARA